MSFYSQHITLVDDVKYDNFIKKRIIMHICDSDDCKSIVLNRNQRIILQLLNNVPPDLLTYDMKYEITKRMKYITRKYLKECIMELEYNDEILSYI